MNHYKLIVLITLVFNLQAVGQKRQYSSVPFSKELAYKLIEDRQNMVKQEIEKQKLKFDSIYILNEYHLTNIDSSITEKNIDSVLINKQIFNNTQLWYHPYKKREAKILSFYSFVFDKSKKFLGIHDGLYFYKENLYNISPSKKIYDSLINLQIANKIHFLFTIQRTLRLRYHYAFTNEQTYIIEVNQQNIPIVYTITQFLNCCKLKFFEFERW